MRQKVSLEEALEIMLSFARPLETTTINLAEALGMALAEDITSPHPLPPFDRSPLDGYALRAADTTRADQKHPAIFTVTETVYAGHTSESEVRPGTAIGITTGAPIPSGADCVVRFEDTGREGDRLLIYASLKQGQNVVRAGEDVAKGEKVLTAGTVVDAGVTGLLVALGKNEVKVYRRPRVFVFSTGDELLLPNEALKKGKIYDSNLPALAAQVREAGGSPLLGGLCLDDRMMIAKTIAGGLAKTDLVISTGGVSVGERDLFKEAMEEAGVELLFWKTGFKPGMPVMCGHKEGRLVVGLSGNPAAAMTSFTLLVRPVIRNLSGYREIFQPRVQVRMAEDFPKGGKQRRFVRAVVQWQDGGYIARLAGSQSPGVLRSLAKGNALIDVPADYGPLRIGEIMEAILIKQAEPSNNPNRGR